MPEQPKIHQMARPESFCFQVAKARRQSRMWHVCTVIQNMWDIPDSRCPVFWIYILHFFQISGAKYKGKVQVWIPRRGCKAALQFWVNLYIPIVLCKKTSSCKHTSVIICVNVYECMKSRTCCHLKRWCRIRIPVTRSSMVFLDQTKIVVSIGGDQWGCLWMGGGMSHP